MEHQNHAHEGTTAEAKDNAEFERLFKRFYGPILNFFRRGGFSSAEAEDLAQETFLRVYRGLESYRSESSNTWIFRIARNTWANEIRRHHTQKRAGAMVSIDTPAALAVVDESTGPEQGVLLGESLELVQKAVDELPPKMRQVINLSFSGHRIGEISSFLKITHNSVRSHLQVARSRLRDALSGSGE
jgi:RNA polymerase sigma-70 factor, ECF subfamily